MRGCGARFKDWLLLTVLWYGHPVVSPSYQDAFVWRHWAATFEAFDTKTPHFLEPRLSFEVSPYFRIAVGVGTKPCNISINRLLSRSFLASKWDNTNTYCIFKYTEAYNLLEMPINQCVSTLIYICYQNSISSDYHRMPKLRTVYPSDTTQGEN